MRAACTLNNFKLKFFQMFLTFAGVWTLGPDLPVPLLFSQMLEHPGGGVILMGGALLSPDFTLQGHDGIYHLPYPPYNWLTWPQKLKSGRFFFSAVQAPYVNATCAG